MHPPDQPPAPTHKPAIAFLDQPRILEGAIRIGEWRRWWIDVIPMLYNHRLVMTPNDNPHFYEHGWCYPTFAAAYAAAIVWNPATTPEPTGFIKAAIARTLTSIEQPGQTAPDADGSHALPHAVVPAIATPSHTAVASTPPPRRRPMPTPPDPATFTPPQAAVSAWLAWLIELSARKNRPPGCHYGSPEELILREGTWYHPSTEPEKMIYPKECFTASAALAQQRPDLTYVEGYARGFAGLVFEHAWCATADGTVVDPAWEEPGDAYLGIAIHQATYRRYTRDSKLATVLFAGRTDRWRALTEELLQF